MVNSSTLKPITTSTFSFPDVIGKGFVYVDKTEYVRELLRDGKNQYFCARPRDITMDARFATLFGCAFDWDKRNLGEWRVS